MEVLEGFILILLLNSYLEMVKSQKILFFFFELKSFILTLSIDVLEGFILTLLLKATGRERKKGRA